MDPTLLLRMQLRVWDKEAEMVQGSITDSSHNAPAQSCLWEPVEVRRRCCSSLQRPLPWPHQVFSSPAATKARLPVWVCLAAGAGWLPLKQKEIWG